MSVSVHFLVFAFVLTSNKAHKCKHMPAKTNGAQCQPPANTYGLANTKMIEQQQQTAKNNRLHPYLNVQLLNTILVNELTLAVTLLVLGPALQLVKTEVHLANINLVARGFIAAIPLLAIQFAAARSDRKVFQDANISTTLFTYAFFGPVSRPLFVLIVASLVSLLTGTVEEIAFRGSLLPFVARNIPQSLNLSDAAAQGIGVLASSLTFALGHIPAAFVFKAGKLFTFETAFTFIYELGFGLYFAILYLWTGELTVPIVSHACYDTFVFLDTHLAITSQIEYARSAAAPSAMALRMDQGGGASRWGRRMGSDYVDRAREIFLLMDADRDGTLSLREFRSALYSLGVDGPPGGSEFEFTMADVDGSGGLSFDEFLDFVGSGTSPSPRILKRAIIGGLK